MDEKFAQKLCRKKEPATNWSTAAGTFSTTGTVQTLMQFPDFSETMTVKRSIHLTKSVSPLYDIIIGRNLMKELGVTIDFKDGLVHQGTQQVTMRDMDARPSLRNSIRSGYMNQSYDLEGEPLSGRHTKPKNPVRTLNDAQFATGIKEPASTKAAVERASQILDAKYAPVAPEQILENNPHLSEEKKHSLKPILYKHIRLFDGTLGKYKLEQRDPN